MTQWQRRSGRKTTGGLLKRHSKKKKYQRGRDFVPAHVAAVKARKIRTKGGGEKLMMLGSDVANVIVKGKAQKAKILTVAENAADSQFVRRNIITKGSIIQTELGKARVTSRPGQHGVVNAVLVEESHPNKPKA
ncbi:MAG: 30S ribosomal protein S8e [Candidatus Aenigmarchaeota archaeon]|nr:30S ribosomal protein S8e [Candidatus Aenigmarchaeota archaeon]